MMHDGATCHRRKLLFWISPEISNLAYKQPLRSKSLGNTIKDVWITEISAVFCRTVIKYVSAVRIKNYCRQTTEIYETIIC